MEKVCVIVRDDDLDSPRTALRTINGRKPHQDVTLSKETDCGSARSTLSGKGHPGIPSPVIDDAGEEEYLWFHVPPDYIVDQLRKDVALMCNRDEAECYFVLLNSNEGLGGEEKVLEILQHEDAPALMCQLRRGSFARPAVSPHQPTYYQDVKDEAKRWSLDRRKRDKPTFETPKELAETAGSVVKDPETRLGMPTEVGDRDLSVLERLWQCFCTYSVLGNTFNVQRLSCQQFIALLSDCRVVERTLHVATEPLIEEQNPNSLMETVSICSTAPEIMSTQQPRDFTYHLSPLPVTRCRLIYQRHLKSGMRGLAFRDFLEGLLDVFDHTVTLGGVMEAVTTASRFPDLVAIIVLPSVKNSWQRLALHKQTSLTLSILASGILEPFKSLVRGLALPYANEYQGMTGWKGFKSGPSVRKSSSNFSKLPQRSSSPSSKGIGRAAKSFSRAHEPSRIAGKRLSPPQETALSFDFTSFRSWLADIGFLSLPISLHEVAVVYIQETSGERLASELSKEAPKNENEEIRLPVDKLLRTLIRVYLVGYNRLLHQQIDRSVKEKVDWNDLSDLFQVIAKGIIQQMALGFHQRHKKMSLPASSSLTATARPLTPQLSQFFNSFHSKYLEIWRSDDCPDYSSAAYAMKVCGLTSTSNLLPELSSSSREFSTTSKRTRLHSSPRKGLSAGSSPHEPRVSGGIFERLLQTENTLMQSISKDMNEAEAARALREMQPLKLKELQLSRMFGRMDDIYREASDAFELTASFEPDSDEIVDIVSSIVTLHASATGLHDESLDILNELKNTLGGATLEEFDIRAAVTFANFGYLLSRCRDLLDRSTDDTEVCENLKSSACATFQRALTLFGCGLGLINDESVASTEGSDLKGGTESQIGQSLLALGTTCVLLGDLKMFDALEGSNSPLRDDSTAIECYEAAICAFSMAKAHYHSGTILGKSDVGSQSSRPPQPLLTVPVLSIALALHRVALLHAPVSSRAIDWLRQAQAICEDEGVPVAGYLESELFINSRFLSYTSLPMPWSVEDEILEDVGTASPSRQPTNLLCPLAHFRVESGFSTAGPLKETFDAIQICPEFEEILRKLFCHLDEDDSGGLSKEEINSVNKICDLALLSHEEFAEMCANFNTGRGRAGLTEDAFVSYFKLLALKNPLLLVDTIERIFDHLSIASAANVDKSAEIDEAGIPEPLRKEKEVDLLMGDGVSSSETAEGSDKVGEAVGRSVDKEDGKRSADEASGTNKSITSPTIRHTVEKDEDDVNVPPTKSLSPLSVSSDSAVTPVPSQPKLVKKNSKIHSAILEEIPAPATDRKLFRKSKSALPRSQESVGDLSGASGSSENQRLADYFLVMSLGELSTSVGDKELSASSSPDDLEFEVQVTDRYPLIDYPDTLLPKEIARLCFPAGGAPKSFEEIPMYFDTVSTDVSGARLYISCLHVYEPRAAEEVIEMLSASRASSNGSKSAVLPKWIIRTFENGESQYELDAEFYAPICLCVISHYPLFRTYRGFLKQLYRISRSIVPIPLERILINFMQDVPLPPEGIARVQYILGDKCFVIRRPPPTDLPLLDMPAKPLFQCLNIENIVKVFACLLTERKVAVCCRSYTLLTPITEIFRSLLFPFDIPTIYIPVLPKSLVEALNAPVPFLIGLHSGFLSEGNLPDGVVFVDLDLNSVTFPAGDAEPKIPKEQRRKLIQRLEELSVEILGKEASLSGSSTERVEKAALSIFDSSPSELRPIPESSWTASSAYRSLQRDGGMQADFDLEQQSAVKELRTAFLAFNISLLRDYRKYIGKQSSADEKRGAIKFDVSGFLNDHPSTRDICEQLFQTQLFERFVEQRVETTSFNEISASSINLKAGQDDPTTPWLSKIFGNRGRSAATLANAHIQTQMMASVRLFDELIISKGSKSKSRKDSSGQSDNNSMPFQTYVAPPPSVFGLPSTDFYHYERFPRLHFDILPTAGGLMSTQGKKEIPTSRAAGQTASTSVSDSGVVQKDPKIKATGTGPNTSEGTEVVRSILGEIVLQAEVESWRRQYQHSQEEAVKLRELLASVEEQMKQKQAQPTTPLPSASGPPPSLSVLGPATLPRPASSLLSAHKAGTGEDDITFTTRLLSPNLNRSPVKQRSLKLSIVKADAMAYPKSQDSPLPSSPRSIATDAAGSQLKPDPRQSGADLEVSSPPPGPKNVSFSLPKSGKESPQSPRSARFATQLSSPLSIMITPRSPVQESGPRESPGSITSESRARRTSGSTSAPSSPNKESIRKSFAFSDELTSQVDVARQLLIREKWSPFKNPSTPSPEPPSRPLQRRPKSPTVSSNMSGEGKGWNLPSSTTPSTSSSSTAALASALSSSLAVQAAFKEKRLTSSPPKAPLQNTATPHLSATESSATLPSVQANARAATPSHEQTKEQVGRLEANLTLSALTVASKCDLIDTKILICLSKTCRELHTALTGKQAASGTAVSTFNAVLNQLHPIYIISARQRLSLWASSLPVANYLSSIPPPNLTLSSNPGNPARIKAVERALHSFRPERAFAAAVENISGSRSAEANAIEMLTQKIKEIVIAYLSTALPDTVGPSIIPKNILHCATIIASQELCAEEASSPLGMTGSLNTRLNGDLLLYSLMKQLDLIGNSSSVVLRYYQMDILLEETLPNLKAHLEDIGLSARDYASPWVLSLFADMSLFDYKSVLQIWDSIFIDRWLAVFRVSLAIMVHFQASLLEACSSREGVLAMLHHSNAEGKLSYEKDIRPIITGAMHCKDVGKSGNKALLALQQSTSCIPLSNTVTDHRLREIEADFQS